MAAIIALATATGSAAHPAWKTAKTVRVVVTQNLGGDTFPRLPAREWAEKLLEVWGLDCVDPAGPADVTVRVNITGTASQHTYERVTGPFLPVPSPFRSTPPDPANLGQRYTEAKLETRVVFEADSKEVAGFSFSGSAGPIYTIEWERYKSPSDAPFAQAFREDDDKKFWQCLYRLREDATPLHTALSHRDPGIRMRSAKVLGYVGDAAAVVPLLGALADADQTVRAVVRESLDRIEPGWKTGAQAREQLPNLLRLLTGSMPAVKRELAGLLGEMRDARAIPALVATLSDWEACGEAADALAAIDLEWRKTPAAREAAARFIQRVRAGGAPDKGAVRAIGFLAVAEAGDALLPLLNSSDKDTRRAAIWALGRIGEKRAYDPIRRIAAANREPKEIREAAVEAAIRLAGGQPAQAAGADIRSWIIQARQLVAGEKFKEAAGYCRKVLEHAEKESAEAREGAALLVQCREAGVE